MYLYIVIIIIVLGIFFILWNRFQHFTNTDYLMKINLDDFEYHPRLSKNNIIELRKGQKKMSNMLKEFDKICMKYNIRYFLVGGSLIGALAYGGWIPWDADVDIEVHEDDYMKLCEILQKELPSTMWFQNKDTDKRYLDGHIIIGKIRDLNSCYTSIKYNWHGGLQIDVNKYKEIDGIIQFPDNIKVDYLTHNDIYPLKRVKFDDFEVNIMNNSEKYLKNNYGKKWYENLPINKRFPHEGNVDATNTCHYHYEMYPDLYPKK